MLNITYYVGWCNSRGYVWWKRVSPVLFLKPETLTSKLIVFDRLMSVLERSSSQLVSPLNRPKPLCSVSSITIHPAKKVETKRENNVSCRRPGNRPKTAGTWHIQHAMAFVNWVSARFPQNKIFGDTASKLLQFAFLPSGTVCRDFRDVVITEFCRGFVLQVLYPSMIRDEATSQHTPRVFEAIAKLKLRATEVYQPKPVQWKGSPQTYPSPPPEQATTEPQMSGSFAGHSDARTK